jgi:hypothetical protein
MSLLMQMNRMRWRPLFVGLLAWIGLGVAASCSSDDQAPGGGRIEYPGGPGPTKAPPTPTSLAPPPASAAETPASSEDRRPSLSEIFEQKTGIKLSPLEKVIAEDCPERAWSKNVPQRRCTNDGECGDGFCDRDRCAPLWTCFKEYGRRCEKDDHCAFHLCVDRRCRSCISDKECKSTRDNQDPICTDDPWVPGSRSCRGVVPSIKGDVMPGPPPQGSRQ